MQREGEEIGVLVDNGCQIYSEVDQGGPSQNILRITSSILLLLLLTRSGLVFLAVAWTGTVS